MSVKRKILIVGDPRSTLIYERARIPLKYGYEVHWFSNIPWKDRDIVFHFVRYFDNIPFFTTLFSGIGLLCLLVKLRPDIVHVFWANNRFLNLIMCCFRSIIVTVRGGDILPDQFMNTSISRKMVKFLLDRAQCITSKSEYLDKAIMDIGAYGSKIRRITWGVDLEKFCQNINTDVLRGKLGLSRNCKVIFSVRACKRVYRHDLILRAFAEFHERSELDAVLIIPTFLAEDDYLQELRVLIDSFGLKNAVRLIEPISRDDMPVYLNISDIVVSFPASDGMPQSLYESMACGTFHIMPHLPQYKELINHKYNGYYVDKDNPAELSKAFEWVFENRNIIEKSKAINLRIVEDVANRRKEEKMIIDEYDKLTQGA